MKSAALLIAALALTSCANGAGRRGVERAPDGQRVPVQLPANTRPGQRMQVNV